MREPSTFEEAVDSVLADLRAVMVERQRKYGPANIQRFGELGCLIRASDKLARLEHFYVGQGRETPDESVDDSWTDLAGYAVIALMVRRGYWGLPLEEDGEDA